jgi:L,D-peptidoglycan transpeptidase YkuD (ErfK/YbiS/YcfS/YnhG family)
MAENIKVGANNILTFKGKEYRCVIGKNGIYPEIKEGDWATPAGCFPIRKVFYREDRVSKPQSVFPTQTTQQDDGWSDDPTDPSYNKLVKLPHPYSHENMWREDDHLYDIVVELGQNDSPVIPNKGSAIFIHIARPAFTPTAGCVALTEGDLREVLSNCTSDTQICIG